VYQLIICGPNKKHIKVAEMSNGPKAIVIFDLNLPRIIRHKETKLPAKEAIKIIKMASSGPPMRSPRAKHNFTSPPPIHLPSEI